MAPDQVVRVGILGAGSAARGHAAAYARIPGVQIAAIWNRTRGHAERLARDIERAADAQSRTPAVCVCDSWRELIDRGGVDAISITTSAFLRSEPFAAALAAGKHVLVEKPLAHSPAEAGEMARLAARTEAVAAVSLNWRYSPGFQLVRQAIDAGQIGRVLEIQTEWRLRAAVPFDSWRLRSDVGGVLREVGSHEFDRARVLIGQEFARVVGQLASPFGQPARVDAPPGASFDGSAQILAEFDGGCRGVFHFTYPPGQPWRQITVYGADGTLTLTSDWVTIRSAALDEPPRALSNEVTVVRQRVDDTTPVTLEIPESDRQPAGLLTGQQTWNRLIADFVDAIRRGDVAHRTVPALPRLADGLRAQEVIAAAERAHAERRWVAPAT